MFQHTFNKSGSLSSEETSLPDPAPDLTNLTDLPDPAITDLELDLEDMYITVPSPSRAAASESERTSASSDDLTNETVRTVALGRDTSASLEEMAGRTASFRTLSEGNPSPRHTASFRTLSEGNPSPGRSASVRTLSEGNPSPGRRSAARTFNEY